MNTLIGITMGCPVGIGPEIILKFFGSFNAEKEHNAVVLGDIGVLQYTSDSMDIPARLVPWQPGDTILPETIPVYDLSKLSSEELRWGKPNAYTGKAMAGLIGLSREGYFKKGENLLFVHTGGSPGLYAYIKPLLGREEVAD